MREYGIENFELTILKTFGDSLAWRTKNQLDLHEKKYIEQYDSHNNGYNVLIEPPNNQDYNTIQELNSGLKAISLRVLPSHSPKTSISTMLYSEDNSI